MNRLVLCASCFIVSIQLNAQTITPTATIIPGGGKMNSTASKPSKKTKASPPEKVITKFNEDFPGNSNVNWKAEGENYQVTYTDPKTNMDNRIVYDREGNIIRKENEVDKLTYPSDIADYYSKKHPKEKYKVFQTEREEGKTSYYINRKGKIEWFDQSGKRLRKK